MQTIIQNIASASSWLLESIFPESCLGCQKRGEIICSKCEVGLRHAEKEPLEGIVAAFDYRDPIIKKAIWDLKYYHRRRTSMKLGQLMNEQLLEEISDIKAYAGARKIIIVPVPLSKERMKTRGYNQAEKIAESFCAFQKGLFEMHSNLVFKNINTAPQARITNRVERLRNIKGAFIIKNEKTNLEFIKGRTFIIIDDVTTTGGTIREIIKLLKKNGAKKVIGFALAH